MLLILHADHEQNCSTSTVRLVGSSHANLFTSVSAGINALWGPLHGGANQAVLEMLEEIRESAATSAIRRQGEEPRSRRQADGLRPPGLQELRPARRIVKEPADKILAKLGGDDACSSIAKELEEAALADDYFIERKLYPNVDFYTGLIYKAMGFPTRMFTVLFAIGRLPGWIAHWREMHDEADTKIGRPRQVYTGSTERDYVDRLAVAKRAVRLLAGRASTAIAALCPPMPETAPPRRAPAPHSRIRSWAVSTPHCRAGVSSRSSSSANGQRNAPWKMLPPVIPKACSRSRVVVVSMQRRPFASVITTS